MSKKIDMTGQKFGRLTVTGEVSERYRKQVVWRCICDCGKITMVPGYSLRNGYTKSCGCLKNEMGKINGQKSSTVHGEGHGTPLYRVWADMISRCKNPHHHAYKWYGNRGIRVCPEWQDNYMAFKSWATLNGYIPGLSIDRINNDGGYHPANCQFITRSANSKKRWDNIHTREAVLELAGRV